MHVNATSGSQIKRCYTIKNSGHECRVLNTKKKKAGAIFEANHSLTTTTARQQTPIRSELSD